MPSIRPEEGRVQADFLCFGSCCDGVPLTELSRRLYVPLTILVTCQRSLGACLGIGVVRRGGEPLVKSSCLQVHWVVSDDG